MTNSYVDLIPAQCWECKKFFDAERTTFYWVPFGTKERGRVLTSYPNPNYEYWCAHCCCERADKTDWRGLYWAKDLCWDLSRARKIQFSFSEVSIQRAEESLQDCVKRIVKKEGGLEPSFKTSSGVSSRGMYKLMKSLEYNLRICLHTVVYKPENVWDSIQEIYHSVEKAQRLKNSELREKAMANSAEKTSKSYSKDQVMHPEHYTQGSVECIDAIHSATVNKQGIDAVCTANIIKYLWRYENKDGVKDVEKAKWYLDFLLKNK